ncbi:class I SAM-dependent methyltransferase [Micromonospora sediminimaris]|nr:class I SAM-dependent methyltransferase [Micromonospora sediminimaris]SFD04788.1 Methyltransferase domain-containing protein [Micromonospora sediminimaris]
MVTMPDTTVDWAHICANGIPYRDPVIGSCLADVQCRDDSEVAGRSAAAVRRELGWLTLTGDERIYHPWCGPGTYAREIANGTGCRSYLGVDVNPAAIVAARRRCPDRRCHFQVGAFDTGSVVPAHDLCLLTYELVNQFDPSTLGPALDRIAAALRPGGRVFADVRTRTGSGMHPVDRESTHYPAGTGIFLRAEHVVEYQARFAAEGRLYLQRFRITRDDGPRREFYSWLWLYDQDEIERAAACAGLALTAAAHVHAGSDMRPPSAAGSIQLVLAKKGKGTESC